MVTAYSFLHHLFDIEPTLRTASRALRSGGKFYADLEPNFYFWEAIKNLDPAVTYDNILVREILSVTQKDEEIRQRFQVDKTTFNRAEYNKNITGGFREEYLRDQLWQAGFTTVEIIYYWYLGQAQSINDHCCPS